MMHSMGGTSRLSQSTSLSTWYERPEPVHTGLMTVAGLESGLLLLLLLLLTVDVLEQRLDPRHEGDVLGVQRAVGVGRDQPVSPQDRGLLMGMGQWREERGGGRRKASERCLPVCGVWRGESGEVRRGGGGGGVEVGSVTDLEGLLREDEQHRQTHGQGQRAGLQLGHWWSTATR